MRIDLLRVLCLFSASSIGMPVVAYATPTISSVEIITPWVNVDRPASSPRVKLITAGKGTIIQFLWQGPSGEFVGQNFSDPNGFGPTTTVQGYLPAQIGGQGYQTEFSPYTEAGTWTLATLNVCDDNFNCNSYSAAQFPPQTFEIVNAGKQDIRAPAFLGGKINTPTVSLSRDPTVRILIHATDDVSGVGSIYVCLNPPNADTSQPCAVTSPPLSPILNGSFAASVTLPATATPGVYTVRNVYLQDIAGNAVNINNPGQIYGKFSSGVTVNVTP